MLGRSHALTDLREQLQSANLAAERQQGAKALRVVAAHDRQNNTHIATLKSQAPR